MAAAGSWSERVLELVLRMNSLQGGGCVPFWVQGFRVGWALQGVAERLCRYPDVFTLAEGPGPAKLELSERLHSPEERTAAVQEVMADLQRQGAYPCLREWRDELYDVKRQFSDAPLLSMERAATPLLGVPRYGVHINGVQRRGSQTFMWIARRSMTKPTYPGQLDHLAAGGIAAGHGVWATLLKECTEEACIPESLAATAKPAGTVSYAYQQEGGIYIECQFVFDLEVPDSFQPKVGDGEVQEFYLWPLDQVRGPPPQNPAQPSMCPGPMAPIPHNLMYLYPPQCNCAPPCTPPV
uniref:Nudix hydrolase 20, chloroplastic-like n=1 Tax=Xenopus tropicalis TaxID=8364 RepID=A0A803JIM4_XENTR